MPPGPGVITETKIQDCKDSVAALFSMMRAGLRSRDIMTMKSFENAITVIYALGKILVHAAINSAPRAPLLSGFCAGGSTNAVLHLLALANEADVPLVTPSTKC